MPHEESSLAENGRSILELASRVELFHDRGTTFELLGAQGRTLDLAAIFGAFSLRELARLRQQLMGHLPRANLGLQDIREMYAALPFSFKRGLLRMPAQLLRRPFRRRPGLGIDLQGVRMEELRLPFPARLTVRLADGTAYSHRCAIPRGAPGGPSYLEEVREKWHREASPVLGVEVRTGRAPGTRERPTLARTTGPHRPRPWPGVADILRSLLHHTSGANDNEGCL